MWLVCVYTCQMLLESLFSKNWYGLMWIINFRTELQVVTYLETYVLRSILLHKLDLCHFV
jgi:hypothetical protein